VPQATKPLNFLLDTGAGVSVVNLGTAEKLGLQLGKRVSVQGVGAESAGYWPQRLSATIEHVTLPRDYLAVDLNELSGACKCHVDGLIGADFFQGWVIQVDFKDRKVRFLAASEPAGESIPLRVRHGALQVPVSVNNAAPGWARLDTGCASNLQWTKTGKVAGNLRTPNGDSREIAVGLAGVSIPLEKGTIQLGSSRFENVSIGVHAKAVFRGEAGLLGSGLLSRFERVTIDTRSGHLFLQGTVSGE
jgi:hypothetical protein